MLSHAQSATDHQVPCVEWMAAGGSTGVELLSRHQPSSDFVLGLGGPFLRSRIRTRNQPPARRHATVNVASWVLVPCPEHGFLYAAPSGYAFLVFLKLETHIRFGRNGPRRLMQACETDRRDKFRPPAVPALGPRGAAGASARSHFGARQRLGAALACALWLSTVAPRLTS